MYKRQVEKILQQIEEFHPKYVCMTDPDAAAKLDAALSGRAGAPKLLTGPEGLRELAALDGPDVVLNSVCLLYTSENMERFMNRPPAKLGLDIFRQTCYTNLRK